MASIEEEETPLLTNSVPEENQRSRRHKILGVFFCLLSSLIFACYNLAVKTWKLDFIDVLCVRATIQIIAFGILAKCLSQKFWPEREVGQSSRRYHLEGFLLLFQVRKDLKLRLFEKKIVQCFFITGNLCWADRVLFICSSYK